jgi:hypothetical protein
MYFVAIILIVIPVFDAATSVWPFHIGNPQWRFAIVGLLSNALLLPMIGGLMAVTIAVSLDHERAQRYMKIGGWVLVGVMALVMVTFVLDTVQSRSAIRPEMMLGYYVATGTAMAKLIVAELALVLLARACGDSEPVGRAIPFRK